jgi:hypothetical protein
MNRTLRCLAVVAVLAGMAFVALPTSARVAPLTDLQIVGGGQGDVVSSLACYSNSPKYPGRCHTTDRCRCL